MKSSLDLSPDLAAKALAEYGETQETRSTALNEMRKLLQEKEILLMQSSESISMESKPSKSINVHGFKTFVLRKGCCESAKRSLPCLGLEASDLSDENLIRFLRGRKFNVGAACDTVIAWSQFRREHPEYFQCTAKDFGPLSSLYRVQPEPDEFGRVVCIFPAKRCLEIFTKEYLQNNPLAIIRGHIWFTDRISHDPRAQICGIVAIISFADISTWGHIQLASILKVGEQNCVGLRVKSVSFFDQPRYVSYIWYFIKPMLTETMRARFAFYGNDYDQLFSILPAYQGGGLEESPFNWVALQIILEESKRGEDMIEVAEADASKEITDIEQESILGTSGEETQPCTV